MPRKRPGWRLQDPNLRQSSENYRLKLRQLQDRQNRDTSISDQESKASTSKILRTRASQVNLEKNRKVKLSKEVVHLLRKTKLSPTSGAQTEVFNPLPLTNCNQKVSQCPIGLESHKIRIVQRCRKLSIQGNDVVSEGTIENTDEEYIEATNPTAGEQNLLDIQYKNVSLDISINQNDSDIRSPDFSPIVAGENMKNYCLTAKSKNLEITNSTPNERGLIEKTVFNDSGIFSEDNLSNLQLTNIKINENILNIEKTDIIPKRLKFIQTECNTSDNSIKESFVSLNEVDSGLISSLSAPTLEKEKKEDISTTVKITEIDPVLQAVSERLDANKECPRYFESAQKFSKDILVINNEQKNRISLSIYEFPVTILKSIVNFQLPAEFALHDSKYFYIQNCSVTTNLWYRQIPPHSPPINWNFLFAIPSKIKLPNFIFTSTTSTPLPVLYNYNLLKYFENFINIYSNFKIGNYFILLKLFTDTKTPTSMQNPVEISYECENEMSTELLHKIGVKVDRTFPTVLIESESIDGCDFDHSCLYKKFGPFKFISLNTLSDNILNTSSSRNGEVNVFVPFTVNLDTCNCMFVKGKSTVLCPIKAFLLTLTNNIRIVASKCFVDNTIIYNQASTIQKSESVSIKLEDQKIATKFKVRKRKITRSHKKVPNKRFALSEKHNSNILDKNIEYPNLRKSLRINRNKMKNLYDENISLSTSKSVVCETPKKRVKLLKPKKINFSEKSTPPENKNYSLKSNLVKTNDFKRESKSESFSTTVLKEIPVKKQPTFFIFDNTLKLNQSLKTFFQNNIDKNKSTVLNEKIIKLPESKSKNGDDLPLSLLKKPNISNKPLKISSALPNFEIKNNVRSTPQVLDSSTNRLSKCTTMSYGPHSFSLLKKPNMELVKLPSITELKTYGMTHCKNSQQTKDPFKNPSDKSVNLDNSLSVVSEIRRNEFNPSTNQLNKSKPADVFQSQISLEKSQNLEYKNNGNIVNLQKQNIFKNLSFQSSGQKRKISELQSTVSYEAKKLNTTSKNYFHTDSYLKINKNENENSESSKNSTSSIPNEVAEFVIDYSQGPKYSSFDCIQKLFQNENSTAKISKQTFTNVVLPTAKISSQTFTNVSKPRTKSEEVIKKLRDSIKITLVKSDDSSQSKSFYNIKSQDLSTVSNQLDMIASQNFSLLDWPDRLKPALLGFMEVHFFETIKSRNPNCRLIITIPQSIYATALTAGKIYPNAILSQIVCGNLFSRNAFLHVRKITTITEIESFIFENVEESEPKQNGFDKQVFMFQASHSKKMPPLTRSDFESLKRLNDSFLPSGIFLLTPIRKNGVNELDLYNKFKNKHLNDLKKDITKCYNIGSECVEVEDLLKIPEHVFFPSNVQISDIY